MIEPEAVIDPEAAPPAPHSRQRRRAVLAGLTLLAVVAGAVAIAGGGSDPKPLALMAGNGAGFGAETMAARDGSPAPAVGAQDSVAGSRAAIYPYGGWGLKFEVEGRLPDLPDHAPAWRVNGSELDRAAIARIADALDLQGTPVQRDGGWFVESGDWTLNAFGGATSGKGGAWYVNLYRNRFDGQPADAPAGPAISGADAGSRMLDLLDRMGAPRASWKVDATDTEIGTGWACAAPAPGISPEELKRMEAEKLAQLERENAASGSAISSAPQSTPAAMPLPADGVANCPPPPPPVKGFAVALYPVLDGRRADWPVWSVTMRSDGKIENLSGSWVTFERAGDYKLRGVDAALDDLTSPPVAYATDLPAVATEPATAPPAQASAGVVEGSGTAGSASGRRPLEDDVATAPAPDIAPCPPAPMPMPAEEDKAVSSMMACAPPAPQVVKITGVELGLIQTSVFEDGQVRMAMVPSYRFTGHFDNGSPWETSVLALHPDAIAPPPDYPVDTDVRSGGGVTGVGKAVPPTPAPEPAVVRE